MSGLQVRRAQDAAEEAWRVSSEHSPTGRAEARSPRGYSPRPPKSRSGTVEHHSVASGGEVWYQTALFRCDVLLTQPGIGVRRQSGYLSWPAHAMWYVEKILGNPRGKGGAGVRGGEGGNKTLGTFPRIPGVGLSPTSRPWLSPGEVLVLLIFVRPPELGGVDEVDGACCALD